MLRPLAPPTRLRRRQDRPDRRQRPDAMLAIDHGCRTGMRVLEAWGLHALGLAREVAAELFLSPRTVDSHPTDLLETRTAFANRAGAPRDRQPAEVRPRYRRRVRGDDGLDHGRVGPDHGPQVRTPHVRICGRELEQERARPPGNPDLVPSITAPAPYPTNPPTERSQVPMMPPSSLVIMTVLERGRPCPIGLKSGQLLIACSAPGTVVKVSDSPGCWMSTNMVR